MQKKDVRNTNREELEAFFKESNEPSFRINQLLEWIWEKGAHGFNDMSNLPLSLRTKLSEAFEFRAIAVNDYQKSEDGTIKNAVLLHDGNVVESVLIPTEKRTTACVSSQVGCSLDCHFCATALLKRMRNLNPDEIFDQVVLIDRQSKEQFNRPLSNIVFMGMGEPLLNYQNVLGAIDKITSPKGLNISAKRITLSTVGLPKMIKKLADDAVKFNLAVSLHSAIDEKRSSIMPINKVNPLSDLLESLQYWYKATTRKVTFEYVVWKGLNDGKEDILALREFCKRVPSKVNLIEYNAIGDSRFEQADSKVLDDYQRILAQEGIVAKIRRSRGKDIDAACGQLANKNSLNS
mgnify:CR=1 FL=1|jgi:23S rRNA (adenine2503-C2)-methyltransferase